MYEIDKDVPLPIAAEYPFGAMRVGDSFEVPHGKTVMARSAANAFGRENVKSFTSQTTEIGVRIWRTA